MYDRAGLDKIADKCVSLDSIEARVLEIRIGLIISGQRDTSKNIAAEFCVSKRTIDGYFLGIYKKLGVHSSAAAVLAYTTYLQRNSDNQ